MRVDGFLMVLGLSLRLSTGDSGLSGPTCWISAVFFAIYSPTAQAGVCKLLQRLCFKPLSTLMLQATDWGRHLLPLVKVAYPTKPW